MPMNRQQRSADRVAKKARARKAATALLASVLSTDDFQMDYDAKVDIPAKSNGAWVTVRIWVMS